MKNTSRALTLYVAVALGGLAAGCAAAVTCLPGEPSVNCCVKKFPLTPLESCGVPAAEAARLLEAMEIAGEIAAYEALEEEEPTGATGETDEAGVQAVAAAPEPPECKGQHHHVISRPIAKALEDHLNLGGLYKPRDPRFVAKARDEKAHCGYQRWHRDVDQEIINWLAIHKRATAKEFETFLRALYNRSALRERFPHGF